MAVTGWNRWVLVLLLTAGTAVAAEPGGAKSISAHLLEQVEHWHEQAEKGDANAMFNLGQYFRRGIGIQPDLQRAREYYLQAAELGHAGAQLNLGTLYYFAPDKPNLEQVLHWWGQSAHQGEPRAQYQLAVLSLKLPQPQPLDALAWMTLARDNGHPQAEKALQQLKTSVPAATQAGLAQRLVELRSGGKGVVPVAADRLVAVAMVEPEPEPQLQPKPDESVAAQADEQTTPSAVVESARQSEADAVPVEARSAPAPASEPEVKDAAPEPMPPAAKPVMAWSGALFTVQLASLSDASAAQTMMRQLAQRHAAVLEGQPVRVLPGRHQGKALYRVQAGAFAMRDDAAQLCKALKAGGQGCFPSRLR